jgi:hypothetical protein
MKSAALSASLRLILTLVAIPVLVAVPGDRRANTIVLDETGVKNLRIQTVQVEPGDFPQTIFALGRIETLPG